jgi:hypothetical protein
MDMVVDYVRVYQFYLQSYTRVPLIA